MKQLRKSSPPPPAFRTTKDATAAPPLQIKDIDVCTAIGKRPYMEDMITTGMVNERFFIAFIFDGHSGPKASTYLKDHIKQTLSQYLSTHNVRDAILESIAKMNKDFRRKKVIDGSTICGCVVDCAEHALYTVNLGDSQCLIHGLGGKTIHITKKDTTESAEERARISKLGLVVQKDEHGVWRMYGLNMTKAFGNFYTGERDAALQKSGGRVPHIEKIVIPKGHQNLKVILGSDGIFDDLPVQQLIDVAILRRMTCQALVELITSNGLKGDNVSLVRFTVSKGRGLPVLQQKAT